jgi:hypothetical protein
MSVSALSSTRFPSSIFGLLLVASLLGLLPLLFKTAQYYLQRQWLLKAFQQFPCPPSHWLLGHKVGRKGKGSGRQGGQGSQWLPRESTGPGLQCYKHMTPGNNPLASQAGFIPATNSSLAQKSLSYCYSALLHTPSLCKSVFSPGSPALEGCG